MAAAHPDSVPPTMSRSVLISSPPEGRAKTSVSRKIDVAAMIFINITRGYRPVISDGIERLREKTI
jgi:hypothetical protein